MGVVVWVGVFLTYDFTVRKKPSPNLLHWSLPDILWSQPVPLVVPSQQTPYWQTSCLEIFSREVHRLSSTPISFQNKIISGRYGNLKKVTNMDAIAVTRPDVAFGIDLYAIGDTRIRTCKYAPVGKCLCCRVDIIGVTGRWKTEVEPSKAVPLWDLWLT